MGDFFIKTFSNKAKIINFNLFILLSIISFPAKIFHRKVMKWVNCFSILELFICLWNTFLAMETNWLPYEVWIFDIKWVLNNFDSSRQKHLVGIQLTKFLSIMMAGTHIFLVVALFLAGAVKINGKFFKLCMKLGIDLEIRRSL